MATNLEFTASEKKFILSMKNMAGAVGQLTAEVNSKLNHSFKETEYFQRNLDRGFGKLGNSMQSFGQAMSVGVTLPTVLAARAASNAFAEYDALRRGLANFVPTTQALNSRLTELRGLAKLPGLGFQEAIQGDIRLQAVGISATQSAKILKEFSNAIAQTGGGKAQLNEVTIQLGQMAAKGKVLNQDLRPIIEAAPAVADALKKLFGTVSSEDIASKLESAGKSSSEFIQMLTDEMAKAPRVSGGWKNSLENLSDTLFVVGAKSFEVAHNILGLGDAADGVANMLEQLVDGFTDLPPILQGTILGVGGLLTVIGPLSYGLGTIVKKLPMLVTRTHLSRLAVGLFAIAVTALASGIAVMISETNRYNELLEVNTNLSRDAANSIDVEVKSLDNYVRIVKDSSSSVSQVKSAKEELLKLNPAFKSALEGEDKDFKKLTKSTDEYKANLLLLAKQKVNNANLEKLLAEKENIEKGDLPGVRALEPYMLTAGGLWDAFKGGYRTFKAFPIIEQFKENTDYVKNRILPELEKRIQETLDTQADLAIKIPNPPDPVTPFAGGGGEGGEDNLKKEAKALKDHNTAVDAFAIARRKYFDKIIDDMEDFKEKFKKASILQPIGGGSIDPLDPQRKLMDSKALKDKGLYKIIAQRRDYYNEIRENEQQEIERLRQSIQDAGIDIGSAFFESMLAGDGLNKSLKGALKAFGSFAIQLGKQVLPIAALIEKLKAKPGTGTALALIGGGIVLKAASASIPALASGGVTSNPVLAMIGDNASGKEMVLPFERTGEFASMIASRMGGGTSGDSLVGEFRGDKLLVFLERSKRKYS